MIRNILIGTLLIASTEAAAEVASASSEQLTACATVKTAQDILNCALERHPAVIRARIESQRSSFGESKASAFTNPEAATTTTYGKSLGDKLWTFEGSLNQKIEVGGKRSSRIHIARAEAEKAGANLQKARESAFLEVIHTLNRHRQIHDELEIINEAVEAFGRVQGLYKGRGRLSAEQEVSSEIFSLALGDHKLRRNNLKNEKDELKRRLELIIGAELSEEEENYLPAFKTHWPSLNEIAVDINKNSELLLAQAELKVAEAEFKAARADSWPDVTIGPTFVWDRDGANDIYRYGLNLNLPLPLWNLNRAGRAYAEQGKLLAKQNLEITGREVNSERRQLLEKYQSVVEAISSLPDLKALEKKHSRVEKLFDQGLVSTSLFIEAHRQIQEFIKTRNEEEHEATDALWKIHAVDGRMFEEALWKESF
ncbi:MAG: TolC family protein [Deltaproteobacteria bacterium]|nr:TolC family protein [Deltaproteobacteria bacterium]